MDAFPLSGELKYGNEPITFFIGALIDESNSFFRRNGDLIGRYLRV